MSFLVIKVLVNIIQSWILYVIHLMKLMYTIGIDFIETMYLEGKTIELQLWDTGTRKISIINTFIY